MGGGHDRFHGSGGKAQSALCAAQGCAGRQRGADPGPDGERPSRRHALAGRRQAERRAAERSVPEIQPHPRLCRGQLRRRRRRRPPRGGDLCRHGRRGRGLRGRRDRLPHGIRRRAGGQRHRRQLDVQSGGRRLQKLAQHDRQHPQLRLRPGEGHRLRARLYPRHQGRQSPHGLHLQALSRRRLGRAGSPQFPRLQRRVGGGVDGELRQGLPHDDRRGSGDRHDRADQLPGLEPPGLPRHPGQRADARLPRAGAFERSAARRAGLQRPHHLRRLPHDRHGGRHGAARRGAPLHRCRLRHVPLRQRFPGGSGLPPRGL